MKVEYRDINGTASLFVFDCVIPICIFHAFSHLLCMPSQSKGSSLSAATCIKGEVLLLHRVLVL